jgi:hypothetical protein
LCCAFEAHPHPELVTFYFLARYAGQRRSDLVNMQWDHIDTARDEMFVAQIKTGCAFGCRCRRVARSSGDLVEQLPLPLIALDHLVVPGFPEAISRHPKTDKGGYTPHNLCEVVRKPKLKELLSSALGPRCQTFGATEFLSSALDCLAHQRGDLCIAGSV